MNDVTGGYGDNSGVMTVTLSLVKCPRPLLGTERTLFKKRFRSMTVDTVVVTGGPDLNYNCFACSVNGKRRSCTQD